MFPPKFQAHIYLNLIIRDHKANLAICTNPESPDEMSNYIKASFEIVGAFFFFKIGVAVCGTVVLLSCAIAEHIYQHLCLQL